MPSRQISVAPKSKVEAELKRLQKLKVISPPEHPDWVSQMVVVEKKEFFQI